MLCRAVLSVTLPQKRLALLTERRGKSRIRKKRLTKRSASGPNLFSATNTYFCLSMSHDLTTAEQQRYARQLVLPGIGMSGQQRLKSAAVLVVGAGGLGCPILQYLVAAGVGRIGIVDADRVSVSNLHRQLLYTEKEVGQLKVDIAQQRLQALNPHVQIDTYPVFLNRTNAFDILAPYTLIVDGTDNFPTRYLLNDACVLTQKTLVQGAIFRFEGQISVYNQLLAVGSRGPNYRDIFPEPPDPAQVPDCATGGVLGVLPGIVGSIQANEVIKLITGVGETLTGKMWLFDALTLQSRWLRFNKRPDTHITELIDYDLFCKVSVPAAIATIDTATLQTWQKESRTFALLDVRTAAERAVSTRGGTHIPLAELENRISEIPAIRPLVVYCQSGQRSRLAVAQMHAHGLDMTAVFSLK